jgi:hypothetical protein
MTYMYDLDTMVYMVQVMHRSAGIVCRYAPKHVTVVVACRDKLLCRRRRRRRRRHWATSEGYVADY